MPTLSPSLTGGMRTREGGGQLHWVCSLKFMWTLNICWVEMKGVHHGLASQIACMHYIVCIYCILHTFTYMLHNCVPVQCTHTCLILFDISYAVSSFKCAKSSFSFSSMRFNIIHFYTMTLQSNRARTRNLWQYRSCTVPNKNTMFSTKSDNLVI